MFRHINRVKDQFIAVRTERKLREVVVGICQALTPDQLQTLARNNIPLQTILQQSGRTIPPPSPAARPGLDYLAGLTTDELLTLLEPVVPDHVTVLRGFPVYAERVVNDLKAILGATT